MSEERLTRLEEKVDGLRADMQAGHAELRRDMEAGQAELRKELRAGYEGLRSELHREIAELGHDMRVLHQAVRADIRDLAPDFAPIRRELREADAAVREDIDRRLTPLETWARGQGAKPT